MFYDERPMNKVSCTTGLTVGFDASVHAVVLVMLSLKKSFIRSLPEEKILVPSGLCSKKKVEEHLRKNPKAGIGPFLPLGRLLMRGITDQSS